MLWSFPCHSPAGVTSKAPDLHCSTISCQFTMDVPEGYGFIIQTGISGKSSLSRFNDCGRMTKSISRTGRKEGSPPRSGKDETKRLYKIWPLRQKIAIGTLFVIVAKTGAHLALFFPTAILQSQQGILDFAGWQLEKREQDEHQSSRQWRRQSLWLTKG